MERIKPLILILNFFISTIVFSQIDSVHYLQPIIFSEYSSSVTQEFIYLSTPSTTSIKVKISYPDEINYPRLSVVNLNTNTTSIITDGNVTLDNNQPLRITFVNTSNTVLTPGTSPITVPTNRAGTLLKAKEAGLIFKSSEPFYVNYRARHTGHAGTVLTKGQLAFGKLFFWGGTPSEFTNTTTNIGTMLSITAKEDNTEVIIDNYKSGLEFLNGSNTAPIIQDKITINLNKGESYILYAKLKSGAVSVQSNGWLGARISSNNEITATVGGLLQQGGIANNRDIGLDQIVPVEYLGNEYVIMQGNGTTGYEKVIVIATEENTNIKVNTSTSYNYNLPNIGNYQVIPGTNFINKNMYLQSDKPIYVFHKVFGSSEPQTNNMMFIPPLSCNGQNSVDLIPHAKTIGSTNYSNTQMSVLARNGEAFKPQVLLNNSTQVAVATGPTAVPGSSNWVTYRYNIGSLAVGNIKVSSLGTIQAELMGGSGDAGFGGYYSGFGTAPKLKITVLNQRNNSACTGNTGVSILKAELDKFVGTYQWYKNGEIIPNAQDSEYDIPFDDTEHADYFMALTLADGCVYFSEVITTQECPCYKTPNNILPELSSSVGISTTRMRTTSAWPNDIPNSFLALESTNKGFVITRNDNPEKNILLPVKGMIVYDTNAKCIKLFDGNRWACIKQKCYDYE